LTTWGDRVRLLAVPVGLLALVACDSSGSSRGTGTGFASTDPLTTFPDFTQTSLDATQVGSEGFWGCTVVSTEPIVDPTATIPDLGVSAVDLAAARVGGWPLAVQDVGADLAVDGDLELTDLGVYEWVVTTGSGCSDWLQVSVGGAVTRESSAPVELAGDLAISLDQAAISLVSPDDLAGIGAIWGPPPADDATFRVDAGVTDVALRGWASYGSCPTDQIPCPSVEHVSALTSDR
jgi:hypothetical protein